MLSSLEWLWKKWITDIYAFMSKDEQTIMMNK